MRLRIIYGPGKNVMSLILQRAVASKEVKEKLNVTANAVALFQAPLSELYYLADIAEKAASVIAVEILGNCPHTVGTMALFGNVSSVNAAVKALSQENETEPPSMR